jgi:transglutaminase-like putative cysteine protease
MVAVARLLVFVQAILMLQKKSRRIFEQLGVFCLLELTVAAVFNNAINYGLLLIPIGVIGAWALSLLAALSAWEGLELPTGSESDDSLDLFRTTRSPSSISVSAPDSVQSLATAALRLPRIAMFALAPSVLLVAAIFFYALPRTTDAARVQNRGNTLVGFNDEIRLEQIGQMMQSPQTALRLYINDRSTGQPYKLAGGMYLRGRVLERYLARMGGEKNTATWSSIPSSMTAAQQQLPSEFFPSRSTDRNFYDSVNVSIICESMRSSSLFSIAPYHRTKSNKDVAHNPVSWTISRRFADDWTYPRTSYQFGTHAFRSGVQSELVARWASREVEIDVAGRDGNSSRRRRRPDVERQAEEYVDEILKFDIDAMPTAASLAKRLVASPSGGRLSDYKIAKAMEAYLASSNDFRYTIRLDAESMPGVDPIEQFLSVDRRGHCQYFASALTMMLRSEGIPARIVAGYHTDEFNELGQHYVARQLHAHAWVEALIPRDQLNINRNIYGQPPAEEYWVRLDPTPAGGRIRESGGGVVQMLDMAQNVWDDYVVDMDAGRQDNALLGGGVTPISGSMESFVNWVSLRISRIRAGELGGGSLASRDLFSWPAAVLGVVLTLFVAVLLRFRPPAWIKRHTDRSRAQRVAQPSIAFYAETLDQLARIHLYREACQTPAEFADAASKRLEHPMIPAASKPLDLLTSAFYRLRFGDDASSGDQADLEMTPPIEHDRHRSAEVDKALDELTKSVDLMVANTNQSER